MQKNNELFTTMPVRRAVAKLAVPTVISQIVVILYSLADTFFVGQIGDPNQLRVHAYPQKLSREVWGKMMKAQQKKHPHSDFGLVSA